MRRAKLGLVLSSEEEEKPFAQPVVDLVLKINP
jgi:hypothetical protein